MNALKNRVMLIGNIGKDPEVKDINGTKVAKFSLVTNERYKNPSGDYTQQSTWHQITAWGKNAEFVEKFFSKGKSIALEGKLNNRSYTDSKGYVKYVTEIVANGFTFVGVRS